MGRTKGTDRMQRGGSCALWGGSAGSRAGEAGGRLEPSGLRSGPLGPLLSPLPASLMRLNSALRQKPLSLLFLKGFCRRDLAGYLTSPPPAWGQCQDLSACLPAYLSLLKSSILFIIDTYLRIFVRLHVMFHCMHILCNDQISMINIDSSSTSFLCSQASTFNKRAGC